MWFFPFRILVAIFAMFYSTTAFPSTKPLGSRSPENPLDNINAPVGCVPNSTHPLGCLLTTITRPSNFSSVYIQDSNCRLLGYEPKVPLDVEIDFSSELGGPFKFILKDGGIAPSWTFKGVKNGIGSGRGNNSWCTVDVNGETGCTRLPWRCKKAPDGYIEPPHGDIGVAEPDFQLEIP